MYLLTSDTSPSMASTPPLGICCAAMFSFTGWRCTSAVRGAISLKVKIKTEIRIVVWRPFVVFSIMIRPCAV